MSTKVGTKIQKIQSFSKSSLAQVFTNQKLNADQVLISMDLALLLSIKKGNFN